MNHTEQKGYQDAPHSYKIVCSCGHMVAGVTRANALVALVRHTKFPHHP